MCKGNLPASTRPKHLYLNRHQQADDEKKLEGDWLSWGMCMLRLTHYREETLPSVAMTRVW